MTSSNGLLFYSFTAPNNSIGSQLFEYNCSQPQTILPPPPALNLHFSKIKERKSLSVLEFENTFPQSNSVTSFIPVSRVSVKRQPLQKTEKFRPPSIHQSFLHSAHYFPYNSHNTTQKAATINAGRKKSVKWNKNINQVCLTHSPDDYDRKIDNQTIRANTEQKRSYLLMKMYPTLRKEEVFQQLCSLDFEYF
jgi:hypothetical protein